MSIEKTPVIDVEIMDADKLHRCIFSPLDVTPVEKYTANEALIVFKYEYNRAIINKDIKFVVYFLKDDFKDGEFDKFVGHVRDKGYSIYMGNVYLEIRLPNKV